jgi:tyrosine decarboxylase
MPKKEPKKEGVTEEVPVKVEALFMGPKSENQKYFKETLDFLMDEHIHWRRDFHPEDKSVVTPEEMRDERFQKTLDRTTEILLELSAKLKATSTPWFSTRYLGHMNSDTLMVANLAYMATVLYNPNNVTYESSTATSPMEIECGRDFAVLLGYNPENAWGHVTTDGTVANYEALWLARNLKSFPIGVREVRPNLLKGMDEWELLNMPIRDVLDLIDTTKKSGVFEGAFEVSARGIGAGYGKLGKVIVPQTRHYSLTKAADILGIGQKNFVNIQVDSRFHMDVGLLAKTIDGLVKKKIPILAVVAVVGTTEEGQIDEISEISKLKDEYEKKGISFYFHIDAAYGGYSRSLYLDENNRFMGYEEMKKKIREIGAITSGSDYPTKKLWENYRAIPAADSIAIDPHKMGYVPYSAGGIAIKDKRILGLISYYAAYVFENKGDLSTNFGSVILEGSKAGATAAAVWAAHRLIPLNVTGYGQIVGRSIDGAEKLAKSINSVGTIEVASKEFVVHPLLIDPDFNIVCYAFNFKDGTNLKKMNELNEKIYNATSYKSGPVYADEWITSKTEFTIKDYGDAPLAFLKRFGISEREWRHTGTVYVLRSCILHPWISNRSTYPERWVRYLEFMKRTLKKVMNQKL